MNTKYLFGACLAFPLLPLMYFQGKRIRASVPRLPEATGPNGVISQLVDRELRILTIGESTIAGVGVETHKEGFTGSFAHELAQRFDASVKWKVYARSGYTVKRVVKEIIPTIQETEADLIVIGMGGNDAFHLNTPGQWKNDMRQLIEAVQGKFATTPIVFTNMPPIKLFPAFTPLIKFVIGNLVEILGEELASLVQQYDQVYYNSEKISLNTWLDRYQVDGQPEDFFSDGVHPSLLTYQVWAKDLAGFVSRNVTL